MQLIIQILTKGENKMKLNALKKMIVLSGVAYTAVAGRAEPTKEMTPMGGIKDFIVTPNRLVVQAETPVETLGSPARSDAYKVGWFVSPDHNVDQGWFAPGDKLMNTTRVKTGEFYDNNGNVTNTTYRTVQMPAGFRDNLEITGMGYNDATGKTEFYKKDGKIGTLEDARVGKNDLGRTSTYRETSATEAGNDASAGLFQLSDGVYGRFVKNTRGVYGFQKYTETDGSLKSNGFITFASVYDKPTALAINNNAIITRIEQRQSDGTTVPKILMITNLKVGVRPVAQTISNDLMNEDVNNATAMIGQGNMLYVADEAGIVRGYDMNTMSQTKAFRTDFGAVSALAVNGNRLFAAAKDSNDIAVFDTTKTGRIISPDRYVTAEKRTVGTKKLVATGDKLFGSTARTLFQVNLSNQR